MERLGRRGQVAAGHQPHGVEGRLLGGAGRPGGARHQVVDRHDAGVLQAGGDAGLVQEAGLEGGVVRPVGPQHLQRHVAVQGRVVGQPDLAHAADGPQAAQDVARVLVGRRRAGALLLPDPLVRAEAVQQVQQVQVFAQAGRGRGAGARRRRQGAGGQGVVVGGQPARQVVAVRRFRSTIGAHA
ncbi:MAG TPA: hypothetical protein VFE78_28555 [Gemmataceae bacterium]|nr:hypothetical protein [Gemmataceae bacterium]